LPLLAHGLRHAQRHGLTAVIYRRMTWAVEFERRMSI
jgi:hypothetical protein